MPIASNEIKLLRSASTNSLGGARTSTDAGVSLFDTVGEVESGAGRVEYRCVYVQNTDPAIALKAAALSVQVDSSSPSTAVAVGVGISGVNGSEQIIAAETVAPAGVSFGGSANLGDIPPLGSRAAWIRRTVTAGAAARQVDAATLRVTGDYTESGDEPETFFNSLTFTDGAAVPPASLDGKPLVVLLHGSGGANTTNGRQYRAGVDGLHSFPGQTEFAFSLLSNSDARGTYHPMLRPHDDWTNEGSVRVESKHSGFLRSDGVVHLITERRIDRMLQWADANLSRYDMKKRVLAGGSMGAWGTVTFGIPRYSKFAALYPDRPRFRYGYTVGNVAVPSWTAGMQSVPYASAPNLAAEDGGGSYAVYTDMIAYISNPANKVRWIGWCCGRQDGYATWQDQLDAVAALRATGRAFAFYWNDGDHTTGSRIAEILKSYPYGTFEIGTGWPLFTEHSLDQDPAVDLVGGINIGLAFRNVVESAGGWSCEVTSVTGACTVKVKPISEVFTATVAAKTVAISAANNWASVTFTA